ncbi:MAG: DivIVA domain-containing protein [Eubacteriales bacterium]|nr:DivIVA domain-containing protein [Eubacteriales bacterium]
MITPSQIREKKISTVEAGGYDRGEVNELLLEVIESYEAIYAENKELYRKMEILANRIEEYRADEDSIKTALITAQKMASKVESEAKEKAEKTISDSTASAQQTVLDAKAKADKIIGEARDYVADLTKEKEQAAAEIVASAEKKSNDAIASAKVVAQDVLSQAKALSKEIIDKAKAEKVYHENIVTKLKQESESFKESLVTLYESQLERLRELSEMPVSEAEEEENINKLEDELNTLISNIDEVTGGEVQESEPEETVDAEPEAEEAVEAEEETEPAEEVDETAEKTAEETVEETEEETEDTAEEDEIDNIIEEIESMEPADFEEIATKEDDEPVSEEDVDKAINAFSSDEITPIEDSQPSIPVIEDEPEFESEMPFESYFNVNREDPHNTNETISLIPPDDDEDDEPTKFKGFFKKKK